MIFLYVMHREFKNIFFFKKEHSGSTISDGHLEVFGTAFSVMTLQAAAELVML
jgi:hypothetical protein